MRGKGNYIMTKGSIPPEEVTIINIYASTIRVSKYFKQC